MEALGRFFQLRTVRGCPEGHDLRRPRAELRGSPDPFQPWDFAGAALAPQSRGRSGGRGRGKPERRGGAVARGGATGPGSPAAGDGDTRFALPLRLPRRLLLAPPGCRFPPSAQGQATREGASARAASVFLLSRRTGGPERLPGRGRRRASLCAPGCAPRPPAASGYERDLPEPQRPGGGGRFGRQRRGRPREPQPRAGHVAGLLPRGRAAGRQ